MLTERQKKAVEMLYSGESVQETAQALGVHRSTLWRWRKKRDFRREWSRIDRNWRRRLERARVRREIEFEKRWEQSVREADEELHRSGNAPGKELDMAWEAYKKVLFNGMSLSDVFDLALTGKVKRRKGRRH